jgi:hypothetical protein
MNHLDLAQQSITGEFHPRVPNGARLIEAWESNGELIVCGSPREDDEEHDCDAMGCTSVCHVVLRISIPAGVHLDGASQPHQNTDNCPWCHRELNGEKILAGVLFIHDDVPHPEDAVFNSGHTNARHVYPLPTKRHEN